MSETITVVSSADHFSFMISSLSKQTSLEMASMSIDIFNQWRLENYKTYQPLNAHFIETDEIGIISFEGIGNYDKSDMFFNIDVKCRLEHIPSYKENFLSCHLFSADAIGLRSNFGILSITKPRQWLYNHFSTYDAFCEVQVNFSLRDIWNTK